MRGRWKWDRDVPAWLVSLFVHAALVVFLGYTAARIMHGTNAPVGAELIATMSDGLTGEDNYYTDGDEDELGAVQLASADTTSESGGSLSELFDDRPPVETGDALPAVDQPGGMGLAGDGQATGAGEFTKGPRGDAKPSGSKARTQIYGIEGEGSKFVYVFDRSGSMGGGAGSPLNSAKAQLLASLEDLDTVHQFQIIFYNQDPTVMQLGGQRGRLIFGTDQSKLLAQRFIKGITASGGTEHQAALEKAIKMGPDVIFFLTDADEPGLSASQLDRIRRMNDGRASIHAIEFGLGPAVRKNNFLSELARENDGKYLYIDISRPGALH